MEINFDIDKIVKYLKRYSSNLESLLYWFSGNWTNGLLK